MGISTCIVVTGTPWRAWRAFSFTPECFSMPLELISNVGLMAALSTRSNCRAWVALGFLTLLASLGSCRVVDYILAGM